MKRKCLDISFLEDTDFLAKTALARGPLGEKLVTALKGKLDSESGRQTYTDRFRYFVESKYDIITGMVVEDCLYLNYNMDGIGSCSQDGWSWCYVTGPSDISELKYSGEFQGDVNFFKGVYDCWVGIKNASAPICYAEVARLDDAEFMEKIEDLGIILSLKEIAEEYCSNIKYDSLNEFEDDDSEDVEEIKEDDCLRAFFYGAWYIDHFIYGTAFGKDQEKEFDKYFFQVYGDCPGVDALDYMDDYLLEFGSCMNLNASSYPIVMPLLMSGYFSLATDEEGTTPTVCVYNSAAMKEYKDLKLLFPDSDYVREIDKLIPCLEDPAGIKDWASDEEFIFFDDCALMRSGYSEKEFACAICYFNSSKNGVIVNPFFSEIREKFISLFEEYKAECQAKELVRVS